MCNPILNGLFGGDGKLLDLKQFRNSYAKPPWHLWNSASDFQSTYPEAVLICSADLD